MKFFMLEGYGFEGRHSFFFRAKVAAETAEVAERILRSEFRITRIDRVLEIAEKGRSKGCELSYSQKFLS